MANIWSTSSPKIYAFQDIGEKHSIMRLAGSTLMTGTKNRDQQQQLRIDVEVRLEEDSWEK